MDQVTQFVILEIWAIWLGFAAIFAVGALTGRIRMNGLLMKKEGDRSFSPERVQLLLATLASAWQYLALVLKDPTHLPNVSQDWVLLFGGSHALYLGRRFYLTWLDKQR
jgi:hypothetical protein